MTQPATSNFVLIALLMFATGIGIPIQAVFSGGVGQALGSPALATAILFGVGFILSLVILAIAGMPAAPRFSGVPLYFYAAAAFMLFYIISVTFSGPRIGLGNAIFFVLLGQMVAAATIDHFGLFGALKTEITLQRVIGILVMCVGVYLARRPS